MLESLGLDMKKSRRSLGVILLPVKYVIPSHISVVNYCWTLSRIGLD